MKSKSTSRFLFHCVAFVAANLSFYAVDARGQPVPPGITTEPVDRAVALGATATSTVSATGTAPLSYQWRKEGVDVAGATNQSFVVTNTQLTDAGAYTVLVTNLAGAVT